MNQDIKASPHHGTPMPSQHGTSAPSQGPWHVQPAEGDLEPGPPFTIVGYDGERVGVVFDRKNLGVAVAARTPLDYEAEVLRTAGSNSRIMTTMGLAGEAGEVVDYVKKVEFHGKAMDRAKLIEELGDVYWYFTALRLGEGITLDEVMTTNICKLRRRYPQGFSHEAANARADEREVYWDGNVSEPKGDGPWDPLAAAKERLFVGAERAVGEYDATKPDGEEDPPEMREALERIRTAIRAHRTAKVKP